MIPGAAPAAGVCSVNPARAGMILGHYALSWAAESKPRASGDDPDFVDGDWGAASSKPRASGDDPWAKWAAHDLLG